MARPPVSQPQVITLGCRLNTFESEIMRELGEGAGLEDTVIINTCAVTGEAERQARQTIRRVRRDRPGAKIIVTGCAAQVNAAAFAAMPEVDRVLGNEEKLNPALLAASGPDVQVADIMAARETAPHLISGLDGRTRAFVQVQQGCDHRCTFCIIPFARGHNRSVATGAVAAQVRALVDKGFREAVLTGVDICSYGADNPEMPGLGGLIEEVLAAVPELQRLRLSSIDPAAIDEDLFKVLAEEERLMPHLHLSLQAMDDMVLKRMKRRHTSQDAVAVVQRIRKARPDIAFGADLIAGFPTETDEMFANTLSAVADLELVHLHVFPYSPRPGTPAARMPEVPGPVRKERARRLREAGAKGLSRFLKGLTGTYLQVLVEKPRFGLSQHYVPVRLDFDAPVGEVVDVRVIEAKDDCLIAAQDKMSAA
ncbi:MAG: tRNA (N(6)-L-threonylcarbamoyladenosine(37)-C(2))-methylthiotransferase MtaB [Rhodospirillales bacterium]|nr:tRNA (N(6)-L-threonylcarbamoyladenosine(37)-C(2))-methylthiotransferase MtaB [Rhodospirillales bacterium]